MMQAMFDFNGASYPVAAGYKERETSRDAAKTVDAAFIRGKVLEVLRRFGNLTADECAATMEMSVLSVRPRFSELRNLGAIETTGEKRKNESGKYAHVWRVAKQISRTASADNEGTQKLPDADGKSARGICFQSLSASHVRVSETVEAKNLCHVMSTAEDW